METTQNCKSLGCRTPAVPGSAFCGPCLRDVVESFRKNEVTVVQIPDSELFAPPKTKSAPAKPS